MNPQMSQHPEGAQLRFVVAVDGVPVTVYLSETSWRARLDSAPRPSWPQQAAGATASSGGECCLLAAYWAHRSFIEQAVQRRLAAGGRSPVVLRAADLA
jgi:hypothetical protein